MKSILFVCLGNICRSPLAEGIAKHKAKELGLDIKIDSAGTSSFHRGEAPCSNSIAIAKRNGIDISQQQSRPVCQEDITNFDLIIALDEQNKRDLLSRGFHRVKKLGEFASYNNQDVPDPYYYSGMDGFVEVYKMIEACVDDLLNSIYTHTISFGT
jgi:protein-tyrosine phosphatase